MTTDSALPSSITHQQINASTVDKAAKQNQARAALKDIQEGAMKWRIWLMLSYQDVKLRYRRSVLGPFWITISMAITVYSMGYLYGHLFHSDLRSYFPFLVAGMLSWSLISTVIVELTDAFVVSDGLIKQIKLPYSLYIHRVVTRNIIIFFHNIVVIVPILIIYHESTQVNSHTLMLIPGLLIIYINGLTYGLVLAMIGARYRDVSQIIKSLIQVAFFLTPIMWNPIILPEKDHYLVFLNPFYSFIELIRAPMLGGSLSLPIIGILTLFTLFGFSLCFFMLKKYRSRIVYWL
jgi:lipopolysaccharide transport system permease protein